MIPKGSVTGNNPDALIDKDFKRISDGDRQGCRGLLN